MRIELARAIDGIAHYMVSTMGVERKTRLWAADSRILETNPLSVGYGACGTAIFLQEALGEIPPEVRTWLLQAPVEGNVYPPGLYMGAAGVAWSFLQLGLEERAREFMELTYQSPLLLADATMLLGAAGWGMASLFFYRQRNEQYYLDWAVRAGEYLLASGEETAAGRCWRHSLDGRIHFGYALGQSGIAHFLLELSVATGRTDFRTAARHAMSYDLANRIETESGWRWCKYADAHVLEPYWLHGSSGVGTAAARFITLDYDDDMMGFCHEIVKGADVRFTLAPGQWEGMSGIGDFFLDMFVATGEAAYLARARELAATVMWFAVEKTEGIAFPGRNLSQVSMDYATGAAGVGLFLCRLRRPGPRSFIDLPGREQVSDRQVAESTIAVVSSHITDAEQIVTNKWPGFERRPATLST